MTNSNHINITSSLLPSLDKPDKVDIEKMGLRVTNSVAKTTPAPVTDSASLSGVSSSLATVLTSDDVRSDKVAALQAAIADGSYSVPSASVADKLIDKMSND
ncbi:flagellar biosynthesis anti-sigma factor FlgM [Terriglobus saanensis]|uniref:Negative regulator of flagellin synthesis n=1 Tax=Terriglobus saanensis (strain ATCC BAA-1853 / DSM 23119 / SP1PR4) TaxID=401053 RepID=E8V5N4_TERSS|nr:flagellar biosynthesis anti-sigma factor FlgM [Terriglobus saanensis]ADV82643.1 Anti-sigma-28 factor FlgM family protein [Terriglobus saanensis SP1PR4]